MRRHLILVVIAACGPRTPGPAPVGDDAPEVVEDPRPLPPAPVYQRCEAGKEGRAEYNRPDQARALEGTNGTFTDQCDASGDLVSHQCGFEARRCERGRGGRQQKAIAPCYLETGEVVEEIVACDGRCLAGACPQRCPQFGDQLTYLAIDAGGVVFDSAEDDRHLACTLGFDQKRDTYDCAADPQVGDRFTVEGLGMSTTMCTGGVWGAISDARCTWTQCRYVD